MAWPTLQEYQEAIQNPKTAFDDLDLRNGHARVDSLGLPRPITGAFACVFTVESNPKEWAVKCFTQEIAEQQRRYEAIGEALATAKLPYIVDFCYLKQGIRVASRWYPVLKMEWMKGQTLISYVKQNLNNSSKLRELGHDIVTMVNELQRHNIAHGDLQHGNIIIDNGLPRLVDYDGMYVEKLKGLKSNELGHRNYQHPGRTANDYGPTLDNFSVYVIQLSLMALSEKPGLWKDHQGGDECLLLRRADFEKPEESRILKAILNLNRSALREQIERLKQFLKLNCLQFPLQPTKDVSWISFSELHLNSPVQSTNTTLTTPQWIADAQQDGSADDSIKISETLLSASESINAENESAFEGSPLPVQLAFLGVLSASIIIVILVAAGILGFTTGSVVLGLLFSTLLSIVFAKYKYDPGWETSATNFSTMTVLQHELLSNQASLARMKKSLNSQRVLLRDLITNFQQSTANRQAYEQRLKQNHETAKTAALQQYNEAVQQVHEKTRRMILFLEHSLSVLTDALPARLQELTLQENYNTNLAKKQHFVKQDQIGMARVKIEQQLQQMLPNPKEYIAEANAEFTNKRLQLLADEQQAYLKALTDQTDLHVLAVLTTSYLSAAALPGISHNRISALNKAGFYSAFDITINVKNVFGIGQALCRTLIAWRVSIEQRARYSPIILDSHKRNSIQSIFAKKIQAIEREHSAILADLTMRDPVNRPKFSNELANLKQKEIALSDQLDNELHRIANLHEQRRSQSRTELDELQKTTPIKIAAVRAKLKQQLIDIRTHHEAALDLLDKKLQEDIEQLSPDRQLEQINQLSNTIKQRIKIYQQNIDKQKNQQEKLLQIKEHYTAMKESLTFTNYLMRLFLQS